MLLITIILFIAFIIVPLIDLVLKESALYFAKIIVYVLAFIYVGYLLITGKPLP